MRKRTVRFDVTDEQLKGLTIGTEITATVKGKIKEARAEEKPSKAEKKDGYEGWPGVVELELGSVNFDTPSEFAEMAED